MTKQEKETLRAAAQIIERELSEGRQVSVPRFGRFMVRDLEIVAGQHPMDDEGWIYNTVIGVVRFRPYGQLKQAVRNPAPRCGERLEGDLTAYTCRRRKGHDGACHHSPNLPPERTHVGTYERRPEASVWDRLIHIGEDDEA